MSDTKQERRGDWPADRKERKRQRKFGFLFSVGVILALMVAGQLAAVGLERFQGSATMAKVLFGGFVLSALWLAFLMRSSIWRFLRTMQVGVSLTGLAVLSVMVGVLVPQIDGFHDPEQRVTEANYEEQYAAFRWAEGWFLYHLAHPYGIGIPRDEIPEPVTERLEEFGRRFGREEQKNRYKQMQGAFTSGPKQREVTEFVRANDGFFRAFFDVCTFLQLNRAYKSGWFATLATLLGLAAAANLVKPKLKTLFQLERLGFSVTHVGLIVMLVGGGISKLNERRGILHLDLREGPKRDFWGYFDSQKEERMPFWVRLDRFARKDWLQVEVGFPGERFTSSTPTYTVWPGRKLELDWVDTGDGPQRPRVLLEVLEIHAQAHVREPELREAQEGERGGLGPVAVLHAPDYERMFHAAQEGVTREDALELTRTVYLTPNHSSGELYFEPTWDFRIRGVCTDLAGDDQPLFPDHEVLGELAVRLVSAGEVEPTRIPFRLGEVVEGPAGYRIEVYDATASYRVDPDTLEEIRSEEPLAEQVPWNPAVRVRILPPEGETEERLVIEGVDAETYGKQEEFEHDDLVIKLDWDRWACEGPPRYVLQWGSQVEPVLISEDGGRTPVAFGQPLQLEGSAGVVVDQAVVDAKVEASIEFEDIPPEADGFDPAFYSQAPRGMLMKVTTDPGTEAESVEIVRMATTDANLADRWVSPDGRFYVGLFENDRTMPFEWRSVLSIYDTDPDGRWHVYSGEDGRLLETLNAEQSAELTARHGDEVFNVADRDGDGKLEFVGPVLRQEIGGEADREIRVNDYFTYRGHRFFQTNAIPEIPTYSGIGVVYDPGIETVLTGMYTIIAGSVLAFLVKPVVMARRKRRAGAGSEGGSKGKGGQLA